METHDRSTRRIFIVTPFENLMAARGTRLPNLAQMLFDTGYDVEYVTTNFSHAYKRTFTQEEIDCCTSSLAYRMTVIPTPGYRSNISIGRVFNNLVMTIRHFLYLVTVLCHGDVVVTPSRPVEMIAMVALLKSIRRIRVVLDIRDVWPDALEGVSLLKKFVFSMYCNIYLKPSLRHIDAFVHIAPSFVNWLHRYAPEAVSSFIPPGFDGGRWAAAERRILGKKNPISLVFVGTLQHQLDVIPLLAALVERPCFRLTLVGDNGTGQRYADVKTFIEAHEMANVALKGKMTPEEVVEELRHHDIGVVPMITSSMTNKMFDCIAAYLPVLSLGDNDSSDFVRQHDIGWSAPFQADAIGRLLDGLSAQEINKKVEHIEAVRDRFDRKNLFGQFIEIVAGGR